MQISIIQHRSRGIHRKYPKHISQIEPKQPNHFDFPLSFYRFPLHRHEWGFPIYEFSTPRYFWHASILKKNWKLLPTGAHQLRLWMQINKTNSIPGLSKYSLRSRLPGRVLIPFVTHALLIFSCPLDHCKFPKAVPTYSSTLELSTQGQFCSKQESRMMILEAHSWLLG